MKKEQGWGFGISLLVHVVFAFGLMTATSVSPLNPVDGKSLYLVCIITSTIVTPTRVPLSILVGENRPLGL
jgi:hypothetical protein